MTLYRNILKSTAILAGISAVLIAAPAAAQITHFGDVEIDGSLCVGLDCTGTTVFGFDTVIIKENNTRLKFEDTSSTASFPTHDWRLIANDSTNGGQNKFAIENVTEGRIPFTIRSGARANSLVIDQQSQIGIGTFNAATDIHIVSGNTPTVRLDQDGTSGFTPQRWDLAGNEANFFVRDVTFGSTLPFRIYPDAPSNALVIERTTGDIGIGTVNPDADLHIMGNSSDDIGLHIEGAGVQLMDIESSDGNPIQFRFQSDSGNRRIIARNNAGTQQTQIEMGNTAIQLLGPTAADVWALVDATGITTMGPDCSTPCDGVFEPDYVIPSIEEHAEYMWENKHLPAVGPTLPSQRMNVTDKMGKMLNELEKAHIYIEQLDKQNKALEARLAKLEQNTLQ